MKNRIIIAALTWAAMAFTGLGIWWYVHNHVVLEVEKTFEDGSFYKGGWLAGRMHGKGVLTYDDGSVYEGDFVQGYRTGYGKMTYPDRVYEGEWLGNQYHGAGLFISPKGNEYEGTWVYGQLPEGLLKYADDNKQYEGEFRNLSPDGFGVMTYEDGSVYSGYWCKGNKQGLGRRLYPDGRIDFGYWFDGMFINAGRKFSTGDAVYGIDISKYQKGWDWKNLSLFADAEGQVFAGAPRNHDFPQPSLFVIMKATEGADLQDPSYVSNVEQARKARIVKGAYHFMTTQSDIESQISNFKQNAVVEKGDFPPVLDIEIPDSRIKAVGQRNVQQMALRWLKDIEEYYGVKPIIYTNDRFRRKYLSGPEFKPYDFWVARYSDKEPTGDWLMWQYTQTGRARGVKASVDINLFSGNYSDFLKYIDRAWNRASGSN